MTPREWEILQLLADGRSNKEIGEVLSISPRTVGVHLANIFGKLAVHTRAAAVAVVHRWGVG
ncbi:MAG: response regulator transcription factor [Thermomicrobiales bacterium]